MELYKRVDEVLHYVWDPIGIGGSPAARDEYYGYLPQVFGLVRDSADAKQIADYLTHVEEDRMGLKPDPAKAKEAAELMLEHRDWIASQKAERGIF